MSHLVVANFKSHKTLVEVSAWIKAVSPVATPLNNLEIAVAPSFVQLPLVLSAWPLSVCAQDVSPFPSGSYTGAVSASMLKDLGVKYVIIGHSERRRYFHETPTEVASKFKELLENDIVPILCLREEDIVPQYAAMDQSQTKSSFFCYEPENKIGGSETAETGDITRVSNLIKKTFDTTKVMYGGSVNADNINSLIDLDLAGFLVAGGSLDSQGFIQLIQNYTHAA